MQSAESVYLIFSANKSGEYFGYARMDSAINDEAAAKIEAPSRPESSDQGVPDLPLTIPTPPTATAPKGRIIDDSSRGTIFWEADNEEKEGSERRRAWRYFRLRVCSLSWCQPSNLSGLWQALQDLSGSRQNDYLFYRTRGLRNPWNANREVKIARDGTEIEPSVGRRLIGMFHRPQMTSASPGSRQPSGIHSMSGGYMGQPSQMPANPYGRMYHQN